MFHFGSDPEEKTTYVNNKKVRFTNNFGIKLALILHPDTNFIFGLFIFAQLK